MKLADEVHIAGDKSSIAFRKRLTAWGLGKSFTASPGVVQAASRQISLSEQSPLSE
ncbi:MAG: hypothetical protein AAF622_13555 [Cyanobacteria bacterium P01_C01_bin.147]